MHVSVTHSYVPGPALVSLVVLTCACASDSVHGSAVNVGVVVVVCML